jgi:hypothetical protein
LRAKFEEKLIPLPFGKWDAQSASSNPPSDLLVCVFGCLVGVEIEKEITFSLSIILSFFSLNFLGCSVQYFYSFVGLYVIILLVLKKIHKQNECPSRSQ